MFRLSRRFISALVLLSSAPALLAQGNDSFLAPQVLADFKDGKPALSTAPGEKRFVRTWGFGASSKHPYSAFPGKRESIEGYAQRDATGRALLVPKVDMTADVLGGVNMSMGTLAGWFKQGQLFQKGNNTVLSFRGYPLKHHYFGVEYWKLGVDARDPQKRSVLLTTPGSECTAEGALPASDEWVHIAAVWDENHGSKIYVNGQSACSSWIKSTSAKAPDAPLFSSADGEKYFSRESRFSYGTGDRKIVPLEKATGWEHVRIEAKEDALQLANNSAERLQMRSNLLSHLEPGNYELLITMRAAGAPNWQPRLTVRSDEKPRYIGFSKNIAATEEAVDATFPFQITEEKGAGLVLDINFYGPAKYELKEISVRPAKQGLPAASSLDRPIPADRLHIHADPQGGLSELQIFENALSPDGIQALYEGKRPSTTMLESSQQNNRFRLKSLGWQAAPDSHFLTVAPGETVVLREAPVVEAKEDLRAAGWLPVSGFIGDAFPWWYHGYRQEIPHQLRLKFGENILPNWFTGQGDFQGTIQSGQSKEQPFHIENDWFGQNLPRELQSSDLVLTHAAGELSGLSFYHVSRNRDGKTSLAGGQTLYLSSAEGTVPLPEVKEREFRSIYTPTQRQAFIARPDSASLSSHSIPALTSWHITSEPMPEDYALGKIGLNLRTGPLSKKTRARVVIHDAFSPWRELAQLNFILEPAQSQAEQNHSILFDLRDTLVMKGDSVWMTLIFDSDITLFAGREGSEISLFPAKDTAKALALWKQWELRSARDRFETLSEPRPWGTIGEDEDSRWWLPISTPTYGQLDRAAEALRSRFPDDPTVRALFHFTHPQADAPLADIPLPPKSEHPEWAVLTRENLRLYRQFVDFWIDQRQHPNGELGNFYGDDTDLLQDWMDLALITNPDQKYTNSLAKLAHGVSSAFTLRGGRDAPSGNSVSGQPILKNGLNVRWTDVLHAYEDGLSVQPPDFITDYGNPRKFQYLLDTVSRYDNFILTPEIDGIRKFAASGTGQGFINTSGIAGGPDSKYWHLLLHAGLVTAWYNNDPAVWSILDGVARWELQKWEKDNRELPSPITASMMEAVFRRTQNIDYLRPFIDNELWEQKRVLSSHGNMLSPNAYARLEEMNKQLTFEDLSADADARFASAGSTSLGWSDDRHRKSWIEWKLTGDETQLLPGLRALYRQMTFFMPAYTTLEQSGDRVSVPKQLISQLYLGGIPGSRNRHFFPDFAVSYQGFDDNFAAIVQENTPQKLQILLYSFDKERKDGNVVTWALESGKYKITQRARGANAQTAKTIRQSLKRGEAFSLSLPPQTEWLVTVEQEEKAQEPAVLGDAALDKDTIEWKDNTLEVPLYNLGAAPLKNVRVRVLSEERKLITEKVIDELPGITDWKLGTVTTKLAVPFSPKIIVELETDSAEITKSNNTATVSPG